MPRLDFTINMFEKLDDFFDVVFLLIGLNHSNNITVWNLTLFNMIHETGYCNDVCLSHHIIFP